MFSLEHSLQKEGSDDSSHSSERLASHLKGEEESRVIQVKGESTESELDEDEEDDDVIQLRESEEEERGSYIQVGVKMSLNTHIHSKILDIILWQSGIFWTSLELA